MFTALDPTRARLLHDRVKAGVKELGRWEAPNQASGATAHFNVLLGSF